jgi:predicted ATPase
LAIELAAARVALLGIEGVRTRLDHRFQVLTSGDRTAHRRHRTLREALEWSYQLLSTQEKAVLRRLGVFSGGFTVEAMQAVVAGNEDIDCWGALEHLGELVDKSLVVAEGDQTPRYRLLESIRLFALERLIEHGEADATRTAHRDHYVSVAVSAKAAMDASDVAGLHRLDAERDNILLAMAWVRADEDGTAGLRLGEQGKRLADDQAPGLDLRRQGPWLRQLRRNAEGFGWRGRDQEGRDGPLASNLLRDVLPRSRRTADCHGGSLSTEAV